MCLEVMYSARCRRVCGKKYCSAPIRLLMSARAASWAPSDSWVAVSQMTTNPGAVNKVATCKLGRLTLPASGLAHANWTHSHFRRPNRLFADVANTSLVNHGQMTAR
jgi:hypothetical protein